MLAGFSRHPCAPLVNPTRAVERIPEALAFLSAHVASAETDVSSHFAARRLVFAVVVATGAAAACLHALSVRLGKYYHKGLDWIERAHRVWMICIVACVALWRS